MSCRVTQAPAVGDFIDDRIVFEAIKRIFNQNEKEKQYVKLCNEKNPRRHRVVYP